MNIYTYSFLDTPTVQTILQCVSLQRDAIRKELNIFSSCPKLHTSHAYVPTFAEALIVTNTFYKSLPVQNKWIGHLQGQSSDTNYLE